MFRVTFPTARRIVRACGVYFLICGLSALFFPASWLWAAGLPTTLSGELVLTFGVIGAFMLSLAGAAFLATANQAHYSGVTVTLMLANICDCVVTLRSVLLGGLPLAQGLVFVAVAGAWSAALLLAYQTPSSHEAKS